MHIGHQYKTNYTIQQDNTDCSILEITEEKDLGVLTANTMKVSRQCHEAASKANRFLGMVHRQFNPLPHDDANWHSGFHNNFSHKVTMQERSIIRHLNCIRL